MSSAYARYYAKNREELTAKMREKYDPEKKKAYYAEHAYKIKADMADRYRRHKEERNSQMLHEILSKNPPDNIKDKVNELLNSDIADIHLRTITFLKKQVA
jgi:transposase